MDGKSGTMMVILTMVLVVVGCVGAAAAEGDSSEVSSSGMPALSAPDTLRSNLWLTEALMSEIVAKASKSLPPDPATILVTTRGDSDMDELFGGVASRMLGEAGHQLFVVARDSTIAFPIDYVFDYKVIGVELEYPEVGRTLGIWQRWVARDLAVTASVDISVADSGQLLFKDIVERRFSDRVDSSDFDDVESDLYEFTNAEKTGSGWQSRMEEIVVLGTLVGLIAIYFANTGS